VPAKGFVPDSATAVRIAVAVWIPLYGESAVMAQQPFVAKLKEGVWTVTGSPWSTSSKPRALHILNGVIVDDEPASFAIAKIAQRDARVLEASQDSH
jgi:hypothetical protein